LKPGGDNNELILKSGIPVATTQTKETERQDGKVAAFQIEGDVTIRCLRLVVEDLVMTLP